MELLSADWIERCVVGSMFRIRRYWIDMVCIFYAEPICENSHSQCGVLYGFLNNTVLMGGFLNGVSYNTASLIACCF